MSHQAHPYSEALPIEAGQQVAHLRHVLALVEQIAGSDRPTGSYQALDEAARISAAYDQSLPIMRKRFDALAEETITWAAVGLDALQEAQKDSGTPRAAAVQLALELNAALTGLAHILQVR